jgi:hypothetical protein
MFSLQEDFQTVRPVTGCSGEPKVRLSEFSLFGIAIPAGRLQSDEERHKGSQTRLDNE